MRSFRVRLVLMLLVAIALIAGLWYTSPNNNFTDCEGSNTPRHCVD